MTPHLNAVALAPEIVLTSTLVIVFLIDLYLPENRRRILTALAATGVATTLGAITGLIAAGYHAEMVGGIYVVDGFALLAKALFVATAFIVLLLGTPREWKGEYLLLVLSSLLGAILLVSARELVTFIVAFELLAIPGYLLTGWHKRSSQGHEAALKFYLLGVVATAIMLYGASLLFGIAGSTDFARISDAFGEPQVNTALGAVAVLFVVAGMAFKFSAVPLHFWAPDAYQGAPLPVAAFLSVVSKAAGLFGLALLLLVALPGASAIWAPVIAAMAIVTMTAGNVVALRQTDFVRLIAYSSIAQTGYALVPIAVALNYGGTEKLALESLYAFLVIYAVSNLAVFAVASVVFDRATTTSVGRTSIGAFDGLLHSDPLRAIAMSAALLSLAGIPPLGGWFAKLVVLRAGVEAGSAIGLTLVVFVAINTAIGLYYYAAVIARMWRPADEPAVCVSPCWSSVAIGISVGLVVITGVLPGVVTELGEMVTFAR